MARCAARLFLSDERAFDDFTSGNFEFSAHATAVALTAGAQAFTSSGGDNTSPGTDADPSKVNADDKRYDNNGGVATFTTANVGLMCEARLGGQRCKYEPPFGGFFLKVYRPEESNFPPSNRYF